MTPWPDQCRAEILSEIAPILPRLAARAGVEPPLSGPDGPAAPAALGRLAELLGLTRFERQLLALCAAEDLDGRIAPLLAGSQVDASGARPTLGLALSVLDEPHFDALHPDGPLRSWGLIQVEEDGPLTRRPLGLDERVLFFLLGFSSAPGELRAALRPLQPPEALIPSHTALAAKVYGALVADGPLPVLQIMGREQSDLEEVVASVAEAVGLRALSLDAEALERPGLPLDRLILLLRREHLLDPCLVFVRLTEERPPAALRKLCEELRVPLVIGGRHRLDTGSRCSVAFPLASLDADERLAILQQGVGPRADLSRDALTRVADQFHLGAGVLRDVCTAFSIEPDDGDAEARLWRACRLRARPGLGHLAEHLASNRTWDDLILPEQASEQLEDILRYARTRRQVLRTWGFADRSGRGLGLTALFAGGSGTGKTLAAEVLASGLGLDLYRIDLSAVVSKYIGETEKNLSAIFDAAETGGFVLLFDEADALFGKRGDVKDSHDRYANIEVSYLLQRMEAYRGLAVLTTNLRTHMDPAFLRRLRVVVEFPFPDAADRRRIWARAFPEKAETDGLDYDLLSQLNVAGGNIHNIALDAAVLAADRQEPVRMGHILEATRREYRKLERSPSASELRGW